MTLIRATNVQVILENVMWAGVKHCSNTGGMCQSSTFTVETVTEFVWRVYHRMDMLLFGAGACTLDIFVVLCNASMVPFMETK